MSWHLVLSDRIGLGRTPWRFFICLSYYPSRPGTINNYYLTDKRAFYVDRVTTVIFFLSLSSFFFLSANVTIILFPLVYSISKAIFLFLLILKYLNSFLIQNKIKFFNNFFPFFFAFKIKRKTLNNKFKSYPYLKTRAKNDFDIRCSCRR